jgi:hypothetical protein
MHGSPVPSLRERDPDQSGTIAFRFDGVELTADSIYAVTDDVQFVVDRLRDDRENLVADEQRPAGHSGRLLSFRLATI